MTISSSSGRPSSAASNRSGGTFDVATLDRRVAELDDQLADGAIWNDPDRAADLNRQLKTYLRFAGPRQLGWATKFWMPVGKNVVVIGGGIQGLQIATFLIKRGRKVTVVDTEQEMGKGIVLCYNFRLFYWLDQKGVPLYSGVKYVEITDKGLTITTKEGEKKTLAADTIIPALPMAPDTDLIKSLKGTAPEISQIGDCGEPALIVDAIADGSRIGRAI